jgi:hypothetical protein
MQADLADSDVVIVGLNHAEHGAANAEMCDGRDLPWLQDTADDNVWSDYDAVWRDLMVTDRDGNLVGSVNLTDHDLAAPGNYDALLDELEALAAE